MNRAEHRLVLDRTRPHSTTTLCAHCSPRAENPKIVGLGTPRREANPVASRAEAPGNALARFVERSARFASPTVRARRVSETRTEERPHHFEDLVADRSCRCVIEINWGRRHQLQGKAVCKPKRVYN